ncbi:MAG: alpha-amylase family glycosyl hydrolase [Geothrix sp.]|nr:alpha-amylase family glycosyl hydrolase [Geothrix sp.]
MNSWRLFPVLIAAFLGAPPAAPLAAQITPYTTTDADRNLSPAPDTTAQNIPGAALGARPNADGTATFTVWSPFATSVKAHFYANWNDALSAPTATFSLTRGASGLWSGTTTPANGLYTYQVNSAYLLDPYAKAMGQWSNRTPSDTIGKGYILDPALPLPDGGWTDYGAGAYFDGSQMRAPSGGIAPYAYRGNRDAVIYEASIRDFTVDPLLAGLQNPFGTYRAMVEALPHIQKLGVTHVQLMVPTENYFYDQTRVGIRELDGTQAGGANYNWGYDPQNYFTPTGMYSAAPNDPQSRVQELKTLINEIHKAGMGVILDVVYNHTANTAVLDSTANPAYYYRGTNNSGTGNDTRSEAMMMRKLIVESTEFWVRTYRVDGFRFDLMGLVDNQTIAAAYARAKALNPKVIFEGEGWNMYNGATSDYTGQAIFGSQQANAAWFASQGMNLSMFSDSYRDMMKSGGYNDGKPGFISGLAQSVAALFSNTLGRPTNFNAGSTNGVMNYLTAHDNLCLYDVLAMSMNLRATAADHATALARMKVGYAALLTSQGAVFLHGGDEMFRSKELSGPPSSGSSNVTSNGTTGRYFCHNSYNASDAINMIRWGNAYSADPVAAGFANLDPARPGGQLYQYVQGLIALRKSTDAFRLLDAAIPGSVTLIKPN